MYAESQEGDIAEPESWDSGEAQTFNHQILVMKAIQKCLELGSKEMKEGYWDDLIDKQGNIRRTYHEDTRKSFIESVKSLLMVVSCDLDKIARENISNEIERIRNQKEFWLNEEWKFWLSLTNMQKDQMAKEGKTVVKGFFNSRLDFDNYYFEEQLNSYREICAEVNNLTARIDFYGNVGYTA